MNKEAIPIDVRRHRHVATIRKALQDKNVVVGVSGGADSVALLLLCCAGALQESAHFQVVAAHINHGLRDASIQEQELVELLCTTIGVQCVSRNVVVEPINGSIAAGARKVRYEALVEIASDVHMNAIAVAHHADDQLETMLMALCRGGGLRKLSGIAETRPLSKQITLHRPLLHVMKSELIEICERAQVPWCEDPTNLDVSTPRGRLRKDIIPILRELWPAADRHAANASSMLHAAVDSFASSVPDGTAWDRKVLAQLPLPIIDATLQRAIGESTTFENIRSMTEAVVDKSTELRKFHFSDGGFASITAHEVTVVHS